MHEVVFVLEPYRAIVMSPLTVVSNRSWACGDLHESKTTQFAEAVSSDGIITVFPMILRLRGSSISSIHHRRSKDSKFSFSRNVSCDCDTIVLPHGHNLHTYLLSLPHQLEYLVSRDVAGNIQSCKRRKLNISMAGI
jgi:hypothetical protein